MPTTELERQDGIRLMQIRRLCQDAQSNDTPTRYGAWRALRAVAEWVGAADAASPEETAKGRLYDELDTLAEMARLTALPRS